MDLEARSRAEASLRQLISKFLPYSPSIPIHCESEPSILSQSY